MKLNNTSQYVYDVTLEEDEQFKFPPYTFNLEKLELESTYVYTLPTSYIVNSIPNKQKKPHCLGEAFFLLKPYNWHLSLVVSNQSFTIYNVA